MAYPTTPPYHNEHTYFVLPTYACNLECPHCCTSEHEGGAALGTMSREDFAFYLDKLLGEIDGLIDLRFIGGEPSIWKYLPEALREARSTGRVRTSVFSNLTRLPEASPDLLFFAINSWFGCHDERMQARTRDNFARYYEARTPEQLLVVRYVVTEQTTEPEVQQLVRFVESFPHTGIGIGFDVDLFARAPLPDEERKRRIGARVRHALETLERVCKPGRLHVHDIMPLCLFSEDELKSLRERFLIRGICTSPEASLVLLPGRQVQLCPNTPLRVPVDSTTVLSALPRSFAAKCSELRWSERARCQGCAHHLARECQGGCLGPAFRHGVPCRTGVCRGKPVPDNAAP